MLSPGRLSSVSPGNGGGTKTLPQSQPDQGDLILPKGPETQVINQSSELHFGLMFINIAATAKGTLQFADSEMTLPCNHKSKTGISKCCNISPEHNIDDKR